MLAPSPSGSDPPSGALNAPDIDGVVMIPRIKWRFMDFQPRALASLAVRWSRPLAMTAALGWLAWTVAQWTWQLLPAPLAPAPSQSAGPEHGPSMAQPPKLAETINAAAPWGQPPVIDGGSAQDTRLPLLLRGVLAGQGLALITASGQAERVFRVGDPLPGGAILRAVLPDHVLLERAGALERLALPKETLPLGAEPASPPKATATGSLRALLQSSPAELARHFRLEPVMEAGQVRGYRIHALHDPTLLQRAGLESEDVVLRVNGRSLLEMPDIAGLMNDLRNAVALDIVVLRHGIETPLRIDLNG
ncbi:MAG: type II secretion system protein N [Gammaproteobacteria bacterium]|nr:type II secretion system protein N [Gammaproteobacteria bacterium]